MYFVPAFIFWRELNTRPVGGIWIRLGAQSTWPVSAFIRHLATAQDSEHIIATELCPSNWEVSRDSTLISSSMRSCPFHAPCVGCGSIELYTETGNQSGHSARQEGIPSR